MADRRYDSPAVNELRAALKAGNAEDLIEVLLRENPWAIDRIAVRLRFETWTRLNKESIEALGETSRALNAASSREAMLASWKKDELATKRAERALAAYEAAQQAATKRGEERARAR